MSVFPFTPNCGQCDFFNANTSVTYTVTGSPAGIVTLDPNPATAAVNQHNTAVTTVSPPTSSGTYTLSVAAEGFTGTTSPTVTVSP